MRSILQGQMFTSILEIAYIYIQENVSLLNTIFSLKDSLI